MGAATREQRYLGPSSLWGKSSSGSYVWYHVDKDDFCRWHEDWCEGNCSLRQEGIRGLWRGGFPTAQRAALVAGVQVFSLVILSGLMILFNFDEPSLYWHFCCSCQCMTPQRPSCLRMGLKMVLDVIWLQGFLDPSLNDVNFENSFSVLAGFSACIASNPVDVVRTRMMVQRKTARYDL